MPVKPIKNLKKQHEIEPWKMKILEDGLYPEELDNFETVYFSR